MGVSLPVFERARLDSGDLAEVIPTEYRADAVVVLAGTGDVPVLSAMAHGAHPEREKVLQALGAALLVVDEEQAGLYADMVLAVLPETARAYLEELMATRTYEYRGDSARRYFYAGKAEGKANDLLD